MKKIIFLLVAVFSLLVNTPKSISQTDASSSSSGGETLSTKDKLDQLQRDVSDTIENLKKEKDKKTAKRLKVIEVKIIRALNSIPPSKCLDVLDKAMQSFYGLVSDLNVGVSCGPIIIPPYLPGKDRTDTPITPDCALPPEMRTIPFNGAFSLVNPLYDDARDIFRTDENENEMPDVCEGDIN